MYKIQAEFHPPYGLGMASVPDPDQTDVCMCYVLTLCRDDFLTLVANVLEDLDRTQLTRCLAEVDALVTENNNTDPLQHSLQILIIQARIESVAYDLTEGVMVNGTGRC